MVSPKTYADAFEVPQEMAFAMYEEAMHKLWKNNSGDMWIRVDFNRPLKCEIVLCDYFDHRTHTEHIGILYGTDGKIRSVETGEIVPDAEVIAWMALPRFMGE